MTARDIVVSPTVTVNGRVLLSGAVPGSRQIEALLLEEICRGAEKTKS
jgi:hypothetical protein